MNVTDQDKKKYLQNEISAFEGRLSHIKTELDSLRKEKEKLLSEVEDIKVRSNKEVEDKISSYRKAASMVEEEKRKLESDKEDFSKILIEFKKGKNEFEKEKQSVIEVKNDNQKSIERVGLFIRMVKEGALKL